MLVRLTQKSFSVRTSYFIRALNNEVKFRSLVQRRLMSNWQFLSSFPHISFQTQSRVTPVLATGVFTLLLATFITPKQQVYAQEQDKTEQKSTVRTSLDKENIRQLITAAENGEVELLQEIVTTKNYQQIKNEDNQTLLIVAAEAGKLVVVRWLLEAGFARVNEYDQYGRTALHQAAHEGHQAVASFLIHEGSDVHMRAHYNDYTPLLSAACGGQIHLVKLLCEKNALLDVRDKWGDTALLIVADASHEHRAYEATAKYLLAQDPELLEKSNRHNETPLLRASYSGAFSLARMFLQQGANVNAKDKDGTTALHYAVAWDNPWLIKELLEKGADLEARDDATPLEIAKKGLHQNYIAGREQQDDSEERAVARRKQHLESMQSKKPEIVAKEIMQVFFELIEKKSKELGGVKTELEGMQKTLDRTKQRVKQEREKDINSVVKSFGKLLSEKLNITLYTDKAIHDGLTRPQSTSIDSYLEVAQTVFATVSGDMAIRLAANLAKTLAQNTLEEYRKSKTSYIKSFRNTSIADVTREVAEMVAVRYREQLWELSAESLEDFADYFHEKAIDYLQIQKKSQSERRCCDFFHAHRKTKPMVRELYEVMIAAGGPSIPLRLRDESKRTVNLDPEKCWDSRELVETVGIVVADKHFTDSESFEDATKFYIVREELGNKYRRPAYGDRSDILNPKFRCTFFGRFWCQPPSKSSFKEFDPNQAESQETHDFRM